MGAKEPSRRAQRLLAFQALYGQEFLECASVEQLKAAFLAVPRQDEALEQDGEPSGFAWELVYGVWQHRDELDAVIERFARNWRLDRVGRVELNLLRLGVYEMLYRADVPPKVSMNEAVTLAKKYDGDDAGTFVNGILDAVSKAVDKGELRSRG